MAVIDHRDVAEAGLRVLTDPALWGVHHALTGPAPMSWPEALKLLSAELASPSPSSSTGRQLLERLTGAGVPAAGAELLTTREWAIMAGENDYTTGTFQQITGRPRAQSPSPSRLPRGIHLSNARVHACPARSDQRHRQARVVMVLDTIITILDAK